MISKLNSYLDEGDNLYMIQQQERCMRINVKCDDDHENFDDNKQRMVAKY